MTNIAVLSDIHGNLPALEAVTRDLQQFSVDSVVVAGDVINWGPCSAQVLEYVVGQGWPLIRGNHEYYLLDYHTERAPVQWQDETQFALLPWLRRQLFERWATHIATWPDTLQLRFPDAPPLRILHTAPGPGWRSVFPDLGDEQLLELLGGVEEDTLLVGHTHLAMDRRVGRLHILNPGSAGVPLDGRSAAGYMLLHGDANGWEATLRRVPFDAGRVLDELDRRGFVEECGAIGQLVRDEFEQARPRVYPFFNWRQRHAAGEPVSMKLYERFARANVWDYMSRSYQPEVIEQCARGIRVAD